MILYLVPLALLAGDQALKFYCSSKLNLYQSVWFLNQQWIELTRVPNRGLILGIYSGLPYESWPMYVRYFPTLIFVALAALFLFHLRKKRLGHPVEFWAYLLILVGGGSNLLSHWRSEFVTDTFQIHYLPRGYIPFNLADCYIWLGVTVLAIWNLRLLKSSLPARN